MRLDWDEWNGVSNLWNSRRERVAYVIYFDGKYEGYYWLIYNWKLLKRDESKDVVKAHIEAVLALEGLI